MLDSLNRDLRLALRTHARRPGSAAVIVVTLALGIGANVAIFSFVDAILLRELPFPEADRLAFVHATSASAGDRYMELSWTEFVRIRDDAPGIAAATAYSVPSRTVAVPGRDPETLSIVRTSGDLGRVLGIRPALGRALTAEEVLAGAPVAVLTDRYWSRAWNRDPGVLGSVVTVEAEPHRVVGVMPPELDVLFDDEALIRPLSPEVREDGDPELEVLVRLGPGIGTVAATARLAPLARRPAGVADDRRWPEDRNFRVEEARSTLVRAARRPLLLVMGAAALVLLIACVNVSGMLLARGELRRHEMAVRRALGAGRGRLTRQLLVESLVLAGAGGGGGVVAATAALPALVSLSPPGTPRLESVALDGRVLLVMTGVTLAVALAFGTLPALLGSAAAPGRSMARTGGGRGATAARRTRRLLSGLATAEVALTTVLLFGAVLFTASFARLTRFDHGFETDRALVVPVTAPGPAAGSLGGRLAFFEEVVERLAAVDGVTAVGAADRAPDRGRGLNLSILEVRGLARPDAARSSFKLVMPGYFRAAGIRLLAGRDFSREDDTGSPPVAIVNEAFARLHLERADEAVGTRFRRASLAAEGGTLDTEIVGLVADEAPESGRPPLPFLYLPFRQLTVGSMDLLVRFEGELQPVAAGIRARLREVAPDAAPTGMYTLESAMAASLVLPRFQVLLVGSFAGLALALAAVGVAGTLAYQVSARVDEIGIRRALGADASRVTGLFLRQGAGLTLLGAGAGLLLSLAGGRLVEGMVYGVSAADPWVHVAVVAVLVGLGIAATLLPARRAASVSPARTLRQG